MLEWSEDRMHQALVSRNSFWNGNSTGVAVAVGGVTNRSDEEFAFRMILDDAISENKIDVTNLDNVDVDVLRQAYLKSKEEFLDFVEKSYGTRDLNLIP